MKRLNSDGRGKILYKLCFLLFYGYCALKYPNPKSIEGHEDEWEFLVSLAPFMYTVWTLVSF